MDNMRFGGTLTAVYYRQNSDVEELDVHPQVPEPQPHQPQTVALNYIASPDRTPPPVPPANEQQRIPYGLKETLESESDQMIDRDELILDEPTLESGTDIEIISDQEPNQEAMATEIQIDTNFHNVDAEHRPSKIKKNRR